MDLPHIPRTVAKVLSLPLRIALSVMEAVRAFPHVTQALRAVGEFGKGTKAYSAGNFDLAFRTLKPIADVDPASVYERSVVCCAQYYVGVMYYHAQGVPEDVHTGEEYLRKAAALGNPEAIEYLEQTK